MVSTIYVVSGANRGIGLGFVSQILAKHDDAFVYAGARDPNTATALNELKQKFSDRLEVVKFVSADVEGNAAVAKAIEERHGRVDTVIANAGIASDMELVSVVNPDNLQEHFKVNVTGTVVLFQAMLNLLKKSVHPRFVPISSGIGSLEGWMIKLPIGGVSYGASKAALNWVTRKIHFENEWLVTFPLNPGPVATDMMRNSMEIEKTGLLKKTVQGSNQAIPQVAEASLILLNLIDQSTRDKDGGHFLSIDGGHLQW